MANAYNARHVFKQFRVGDFVKPLQNLMDQHDREYLTIRHAVIHAGKLWQTLDRDKLRQEIKEERKKKKYHRNDNNPKLNTRDNNFRKN